MDWEGIGLGDLTLAWLESTGAGQYVRERRLDPFATSMRDFDDVSEQLSQIRTQKALVHHDSNQRMTDLRAAGLVDGTILKAHLTPLGDAVLNAWKKYGVATDSKSDELARSLLLLVAARALKIPLYAGFFAYWAELRASFSAPSLIHNWDRLYILNYLDHEIDGYAPGTAYRDMVVSIKDISFDLDVFAAKAGAGEDAERGAKRVKQSIAGKIPRGRARATFCIAMEMLEETVVTPRLLLEALGQPKRPREWVALDEDQISKIEAILAEHGFKPIPGLGPKGVEEVGPIPAKSPFELPTDIDFASVLQAPPKAATKLGKGKVKAPKKIDYSKKQKANDLVGKLGEQFAVLYEQWRLRNHKNLLKKISHVSVDDDSLGYDILSWETDGSKRLVEVKSTQGPLETRFFLSANELACAEVNSNSFVILRVGNLKGQPKCCEIRHPFAELEIEAEVFSVTFKSN